MVRRATLNPANSSFAPTAEIRLFGVGGREGRLEHRSDARPVTLEPVVWLELPDMTVVGVDTEIERIPARERDQIPTPPATFAFARWIRRRIAPIEPVLVQHPVLL